MAKWAATPHGDDVEARLAAALARAEAEVAALEDAIISADEEFDGDSDHPSPKARLVASIHRLRDKARASRHLAAEVAALRAEVARLREMGDDWDALLAEARVEAEKAMRKFPQPNYVISKIAEEAGEVVKAAIHCAEGRETAANLRGEMKQTLAMLYRLWVEGDQVHGLPSVRRALEAKP